MQTHDPMPERSKKLLALCAEYQRVIDDHAELKACGRHYYHNGAERYARKFGSLFGEKTMIEMGKIIGGADS